ncbi:MAG: phosphatidate cytidylyltransferase [Clostridia bacterium]|nr:phosphatidate cytidylyltransferase [Clostridia bacterium]
MVRRIISAIIGISVALVLIFLSLMFPICIDIVIAIICGIAVFEFTKAVKTLKLFQISFVSIAFAFVYPMLVTYNISTVMCYTYTAIMMAMMIFFHTKISFKDFAYTYSMTLIITLSISSIVSMKDMDVSHATMYLVFSLATPWFADAGAYFVGVLLGKHKLCPKISPNKTIEGAVGGAAVCILATFGTAFLFDKLIYADDINLNYIAILMVGCAGSLLSILGDLCFSVIKRSYSVKDYGDLIPGHGGILDRFDSVICFAPFLYIMALYYPLIIN